MEAHSIVARNGWAYNLELDVVEKIYMSSRGADGYPDRGHMTYH